MSTLKSEDYKLSAVKYYLNNDVNLDNDQNIYVGKRRMKILK